MKEIWKDIKGYEGLYQISNLGNIKNKKNQIMKQRNRKDNRKTILLYKEGKFKQHFIHRLVAQAFIPNRNNLQFINHKDENPKNNCVDNLEWCSAKYNCNYGTRNERISKKIRCLETNKIYKNAYEIERILGIRQTTINKCVNGKYKKAGGFHWQYV